MTDAQDPVSRVPASGTTPAGKCRLEVEVLYGAGGLGVTRKVAVPPGATIAEAVDASGLAHDYPELREGNLALAAYGRRIKSDAPATDGQRIEILRPLLLPPKEARRQLAAQRAKTPAPRQPQRARPPKHGD